jgi:hypothetical protein
MPYYPYQQLLRERLESGAEHISDRAEKCLPG